MKENIMTIEQASYFVAKVMCLVSEEDNGHVDVQVAQHLHLGAIWGESVSVDTGHDNNEGTFEDTVSISYYVQHHEDGGAACLRMGKRERGNICRDMPFFGTPKEAADYLLEDYRNYYNN